ncbi:restriction endonuclease [Haliscomenobacter sp.]|uniref:restriction endonuclease n=1 Tax=Haliscomenobacter sp. TaxID=2717303 RepID=UPI003593E54A
MKKGKFFELLVSLIEETIKEKEYIKVKSNEFLIDKDGNKRQIDVLIEVDLGERFGIHRTIIECKEESKKIGVGTIGSFSDLLNSLNCNKGVIVSKSGFSMPGVAKANGTNGKIILYTLSEAANLELNDWLPFSIYTIKHQLDFFKIKVEMKIHLEEKIEIDAETLISLPLYSSAYEYISTDLLSYCLTLLEQDGNKLSRAISKEALLFFKESNFEKIGALKIEPNLKGIHFLNYKGFCWVPFSSFSFEIDLKFIKKEHKSLNFMEYIDNLGKKALAKTRNYEFDDHYLTIIEGAENGSSNRMFITTKEANPKVIEIYNLGTIEENIKKLEN